jgi:hypothetical protein
MDNQDVAQSLLRLAKSLITSESREASTPDTIRAMQSGWKMLYSAENEIGDYMHDMIKRMKKEDDPATEKAVNESIRHMSRAIRLLGEAGASMSYAYETSKDK